MNNKAFISELARRTGYTLEDTQKLVNTVVESISDNLQDGNGVAISGFGSFDLKKRLERIITNPSTGKRMLVPPKLVINFRPVSSVKNRFKKGESSDE